MITNLFVGGLPYEITREELTELFAACGKVNNVKLIMDGLTGRSKGFGFVEMATEAEAQAAIGKLNGTTFGQRQLFISEARPQEKRPSDSPGNPGPIDREPDFVERRSGLKDRRRSVVARAGRPGDRPRPDGAKREGFGGADKRRTGPGGFGGENKRWGKPAEGRGQRKDFGGKKRVWDKPGGDTGKRKDFGGKKRPWGKPAEGRGQRKDFGGKKKWGAPRSRPGRRDERRSS